jgi:undecaprenyl-diphosphatase
VGCFAAYLLLGRLVSHTPLCFVDQIGETVFWGKAVALAMVFTRMGTLPAYLIVCVVLLCWGFTRRAWLSRVLFSIVLLLGAWVGSDLGKLFFARPRMEHWIAIHEASYSYASGHAALSSAFYGLWAYFMLKNTSIAASARYAAATFFLLLIIGVGWSRLALGAHYASDVVGGYFLGCAFLGTAISFQRPIKACA